MSDLSPNLSLPFILPAQAQKHVTHNEAVELLDLIVQLTLVSVTQMVPPATPAEGQAWAVPAGADGDWAGQAGRIASWRGAGWLFVAPADGWVAWVVDAGALRVLSGGVWASPPLVPDLNNLAFVGVNTVADAVNRLSVRAQATLFDSDGAGHQIKVNKTTAADTGTVLFQSGYAGRAEMGLAGDDDFSIKVSSDGAAWLPAIGITATTGQVQFAAALRLTPTTMPAMAQAGDLYFDSAAAMLRCYDGGVWHDLF